MYIQRSIEKSIIQSMSSAPVVAIIGPRQCGKSTLVKNMFPENANTVYLDLERPSDLSKLEDAEWYLSMQKGKLICIDEIQRKPELFPLIRFLADQWSVNGVFLVLGSASRDMLMQSSESLAGRIHYKKLTPFLLEEIENKYTLYDYFAKGGFPRSIFAEDEKSTFQWRQDFISTFLERTYCNGKDLLLRPCDGCGKCWRTIMGKQQTIQLLRNH